MATRRIGDALVTLRFRPDRGYSGSVCARARAWRFLRVSPPAAGWPLGVAPDSPRAYDAKALYVVKACCRGDPIDAYPDDARDAVLDAVEWSRDELGRLSVSRV